MADAHHKCIEDDMTLPNLPRMRDSDAVFTSACDLASSPQTVKKMAARTTRLNTTMTIADDFSPSSGAAAVVEKSPAGNRSASRLPENRTGSFAGDATVTRSSPAVSLSILVYGDVALFTCAQAHLQYENNKLCAWRHDMPRPSPPQWAPQRLARRRADAT